VFPGVDVANLLIVPTLQKCAVPLDCYGEEQAFEKDRLQRAFLEWVNALRLSLVGHWTDATDPATGAAVFGTPAALYSDVPPISRLLRYSTMDAGGCSILLHPTWGSSVYPATAFTTAPLTELVRALNNVNCPHLTKNTQP
jgi:Methylmalonic aciduria and homocystinuria type D protein